MTVRTTTRALRAAAAVCVAVAVSATPSALAGSGGTGSGKPHHGGHRHHRERRHLGDPLGGQGMWIWYVNSSSGGKVGAIARKAHKAGVRTVFVKAADGRSTWRQFTPSLVAALHARGLRVCAWQYVYGTHAAGEAAAAAAAVHDGADCFVIDAESQYEGRYAAASTYMKRLRRAAGRGYPIGLASFPYVDYHPGLPYSVFLGPGGAQFNAPQVYWHAIGVTPAQALAHTYVFNRVYSRPLRPLGQTYGNPPLREIGAFRRYAESYGFRGYSWWSWQATTGREWRKLARPAKKLSGFRPPAAFPELHRGSSGDLVVWAQEHLAGGGYTLRIDGRYGRRTRTVVRSFQAANDIPTTGTIGPLTWKALLKVKPVRVNWAHPHRSLTAAEVPAGGEPRSAARPALRDEIPNRPR